MLRFLHLVIETAPFKTRASAHLEAHMPSTVEVRRAQPEHAPGITACVCEAYPRVFLRKALA